jgi:hypothetical protein
MWSEAEAQSEYGVVTEEFIYLFFKKKPKSLEKGGSAGIELYKLKHPLSERGGVTR